MTYNSNKEIRLISLNVNGINITTKRRLVFKTLKKYKFAILCLQETHVPENLKQVVECQWGGRVEIYGTSAQTGGLMTLFSKDFEVQVDIGH